MDCRRSYKIECCRGDPMMSGSSKSSRSVSYSDRVVTHDAQTHRTPSTGNSMEPCPASSGGNLNSKTDTVCREFTLCLTSRDLANGKIVIDNRQFFQRPLFSTTHAFPTSFVLLDSPQGFGPRLMASSLLIGAISQSLRRGQSQRNPAEPSGTQTERSVPCPLWLPAVTEPGGNNKQNKPVVLLSLGTCAMHDNLLCRWR